MQSTKSKLTVCTLIFLTGAIANIYFATALHKILSHQTTVLKIFPIIECIKSLATEKQSLLLFLCLQGFVVILAVLFFIQNSRPYQSDLLQVTPDIKTPVPVGQYQHGSARWLTDEEKDRAFESFTLNPNNKAINTLMKTGYDKLDFLKKGDNGDDRYS